MDDQFPRDITGGNLSQLSPASVQNFDDDDADDDNDDDDDDIVSV